MGLGRGDPPTWRQIPRGRRDLGGAHPHNTEGPPAKGRKHVHTVSTLPETVLTSIAEPRLAISRCGCHRRSGESTPLPARNSTFGAFPHTKRETQKTTEATTQGMMPAGLYVRTCHITPLLPMTVRVRCLCGGYSGGSHSWRFLPMQGAGGESEQGNELNQGAGSPAGDETWPDEAAP